MLMEKAIEVGMDFTICCGHRNEADQDEAFHMGLSKKHWPESKHNREPSEAIDIAPWPIDWKDENAFYHLAGIVRAEAKRLGLPIRWGGDWDGDFDLQDQTFMDLGHFELLVPGV